MKTISNSGFIKTKPCYSRPFWKQFTQETGIVLSRWSPLGHQGRDTLPDGEQICRGPFAMRKLRALHQVDRLAPGSRLWGSPLPSTWQIQGGVRSEGRGGQGGATIASNMVCAQPPNRPESNDPVRGSPCLVCSAFRGHHRPHFCARSRTWPGVCPAPPRPPRSRGDCCTHSGVPCPAGLQERGQASSPGRG